MKVRFKLRRKSRNRTPIGAGLAIGLGGMLVAWGYRRWARKAKAAAGTGAGTATSAGASVGSSGGGLPESDAARLSGKFHSLDEERSRGSIPGDLERDPKNIEQTIHPG